jgi:hypothetical protein
MKKSKTLLLTLFLTIGFTFSECNLCDCPELDGTHFDLQGIDSFRHFKTENGSSNVIQDGEIIDFENYRGLDLLFSFDYTFGQKRNFFTPFNFSVMNTAYGCSCNFNGIEGSLQHFKSIDIVTLNDFDSLHLANNRINEYFKIDYEMPLDSFVTLESKFFEMNLSLLLTERPVLDSTFQVKITVELDNGAVFSKESDAIILR